MKRFVLILIIILLCFYSCIGKKRSSPNNDESYVALKNDSLKELVESFDFTSTIPAKFLDNYEKRDIKDIDKFIGDWQRWSSEVESSIETDSLQVIYKYAFDKAVIQLGGETLYGKESFMKYRILNLDTSARFHSGVFGNRKDIDDSDVYKIILFTPVIDDNANSLYWSKSIAASLGSDSDEFFSSPRITSLDIYPDGIAISYSSSQWSHECYFFPKGPSLLPPRFIYSIMD